MNSIKFFLKQVSLGLKRDLFQFAKSFFSCFGVVWTITKSADHFSDSLNTAGGEEYLIVILVFSLIWGFSRSWAPRRAVINIKNTDTKVKISFGDLFSSKNYKAVPVNEYFDTVVGDLVSELSIHGQFIEHNFFDKNELDKQIQSDLSEQNLVKDRVERARGKRERYEIGSTAVVCNNNEKFFLFAFARTELKTNKAYADVPDLWCALSGLWTSVRNRGNGRSIAVPLVGSGRSGVGLPPMRLLELIILSIIFESKKNKITDEINIILPFEKFEEIDLRAIKHIGG